MTFVTQGTGRITQFHNELCHHFIPKTNCIEFYPGNGFLTLGSEEKNQKAVRFGFVVELFVLHCDISEGFISSHAEPADYFQIMLSFK